MPSLYSGVFGGDGQDDLRMRLQQLLGGGQQGGIAGLFGGLPSSSGMPGMLGGMGQRGTMDYPQADFPALPNALPSGGFGTSEFSPNASPSGGAMEMMPWNPMSNNRFGAMGGGGMGRLQAILGRLLGSANLGGRRF